MSTLAVWRICAAKFAGTAFDGEGSRRFGGRWSSLGVSMVYTSETRALAVLEVLANVETPETLFASAWVLTSAQIPLDCIEKPSRFPSTWRQFPHSTETRIFGDTWIREVRSAALRVPSAVVPGEFNYLLNPAHPDFPRIVLEKPEPFAFDARLAG